MLKVTTESGTIYELDVSNGAGTYVRRLEPGHEMRRDGDWLNVINFEEPKVGRSLIMDIEPLASEATFTRRITSPIVSIEEVE